MNINNNTLQRLVLTLFPLVFVVVGIAFLQQIAPVYAGAEGYDQDPAYVYLLNGLTILYGHSPYHIDHPGTPLQVLVAIVALTQWLLLALLGRTDSDVIDSVLYQPELYIVTISLVLLTLNAWALFYLGRRVFQATGNFKLALFCQTSPLVYWIIDPRIVYLSPEALLIFASALLLGVLAPIILPAPGGHVKEPDRVPMLAGILCGFGVAVKITFVPMVGLLLLLRTRTDMFRAVKFMVIAWIVCMLPILGSIKRMIDRHFSFAVHSGHYGSGEADVINIDAIPERISYLVEMFPFFFAVLLLFAIVLFLKAASVAVHRWLGLSVADLKGGFLIKAMTRFLTALESLNIRVPVVLLIIGIFHTLLVVKHLGAHYMIPVLPIAFLGAVYLVQSADFKWGADYVLLGLGVYLMLDATSNSFSRLSDSRLRIDESLASVRKEMSRYTNPVIIGTYRCILPKCGLMFGLSYAPDLSDKAAGYFADFYEFNIWNSKIRVYGEGWVGLDRIEMHIADGRDVLLVSPKEYRALETFSLEALVDTKPQTLYRVTGVTHTES